MEIVVLPNVEKLIKSQNPATIAKVIKVIELLEEFGHNLGLPHSKNIAQGIFELRVSGKIQPRIFYCFHNGKAHLAHVFIKKDQRIPKKEFDHAKKIINALINP